MNKKMMLAMLLLMVASFTSFVTANEFGEREVIELRAVEEDPEKTKDPIPRTPPVIASYLLWEENTFSFEAFGMVGTLEIADAESNTLVYSTEITEDTTMCQIPTLTAGEYIIQIIFEDWTYWGVLSA